STMTDAWFNGTNGTEFNNMSADGVSTVARGCGDVNGDGVNDVVFGLPYDDANGRGGALVIFGHAGANPWGSGAVDVSGAWVNGTNATRLIGQANNDHIGLSAAIGDFNGDGIADIALGSGELNYSAGANSGTAEVIFGKSGAWSGTAAAPTTLN